MSADYEGTPVSQAEVDASIARAEARGESRRSAMDSWEGGVSPAYTEAMRRLAAAARRYSDMRDAISAELLLREAIVFGFADSATDDECAALMLAAGWKKSEG